MTSRWVPHFSKLVLLALSSAWASSALAADTRLFERTGGLRIPFIANGGQADPAVAYFARTFAGTVYVTRSGEIVYSLPGRHPLAGAAALSIGPGWTLTETPINGRFEPIGEERGATAINFFLGADPSCWTTGVASFEAVDLGEVWRGVHVTLRARGNRVEKIFAVEPGVDPSRIRLRLAGAQSLGVSRSGALEAATGPGVVSLTPPIAYQMMKNGARRLVRAAYRARGEEYGFEISGNDPTLPVVIDPILQATYLGGSSSEGPFVLAVDSTSGDVLVAGSASAADFPGTTGGAQPSYGGGFFDIVVARLNATLTTLIQATYLGGSGSDFAVGGLAIDPSSGDVLVEGMTTSPNFPGTAGGAQPKFAGVYDVVVARLDAQLTTLKQATYFGGSDVDEAVGLAIRPGIGRGRRCDADHFHGHSRHNWRSAADVCRS